MEGAGGYCPSKIFEIVLSKDVSVYTPLNHESLKKRMQCWTVGAIFTFGRSRMFGHEKLRP